MSVDFRKFSFALYTDQYLNAKKYKMHKSVVKIEFV